SRLPLPQAKATASPPQTPNVLLFFMVSRASMPHVESASALAFPPNAKVLDTPTGAIREIRERADIGHECRSFARRRRTCPARAGRLTLQRRAAPGQDRP